MSYSNKGKTLSFDVQVAELLGLHEAIILHQIQYWMNIFKNKKDKDHFHDGRWWVYNSYNHWLEQFPFMSRSTFKRSLKKLLEYGILIHTTEYAKKKPSNTMWYSVDEERLDEVLTALESDRVKMNLSIGSKRTQDEVQNEPNNNINNSSKTTKHKINSINGNINGAESLEKDSRTVPVFGYINDPIFDKSKEPFDNTNYKGLRDKVIKMCKEHEMEQYGIEIAKIIVYFYKRYAAMFGKKHPPVNDNTLDRCINVLTGLDDPFIEQVADYDTFEDLINRYFCKDYDDCDYHLPHFCSHGILGILAYDQENGRYENASYM